MDQPLRIVVAKPVLTVMTEEPRSSPARCEMPATRSSTRDCAALHSKSLTPFAMKTLASSAFLHCRAPMLICSLKFVRNSEKQGLTTSLCLAAASSRRKTALPFTKLASVLSLAQGRQRQKSSNSSPKHLAETTLAWANPTTGMGILSLRKATTMTMELQQAMGGDRRAMARMLSKIENGSISLVESLRTLHL